MTQCYYIPSGPKNLHIIFPSIDWKKVANYKLTIQDSNSNQLAETPLFKIGCCCDESRLRLFFLNYDGTYDGINFTRPIIDHDVTSTTYVKGLNYPLNKTDTGLERFSINANDTYIAQTNCYSLDDKDWLQQLFDSSKAFIQWEGTEGQSDSYIPVKILDTKFAKQKLEDYSYIVTVQFILSNDYINIRN